MEHIDNAEADDRRFAAFISYSHADAAVAATLQRKLERYRLPKHIAATRDNGNAGLGRIFRDREDLAAAPNLSDAIRNAIAQTEALIVLCSPDAATSNWVDQEIALFRSLHPDRPILAALLNGEPATAFPAALTKDGLEPLAADLRKSGDGPQLGFMKIVAGIANVPLDALIQRDAQRRLRRVTAITLGALAAMLIMGVMTTLAFSARNEAARQRAEAEGLVEYMLTDLREKLKGVGRLDVMGAVNKRAMEHYQRQGDLNALPADSLERRARVLHAMGEDEVDLDIALAKFKEAHRTTAALLAREPANADRIFAHAQSEYWVGYIAFQQRDEKTARHYWQGYFDQAKQLAKVEPDSVRSLLELGYATGNLCDLNLRHEVRIVDAEKLCIKAVEYEKAALAKTPADQKIAKSLANRYGWLANAYLANHKTDEAITARHEEAAIMDSLLAKDPANIDYILRKSWAIFGIGDIESGNGNAGAALRLYDEAAIILDKALQRVPQNPDLLESRLRIAHRALVVAQQSGADIDARLQETVRLTGRAAALFGTTNPRFAGLFRAIDKINGENKK